MKKSHARIASAGERRRQRTMSRCQGAIVSGVTRSGSPWRRAFGYRAEQGREQGPVRPVQLRAARLPPLQDGEMVAQDQDLRGLPRFLTPGQPQPQLAAWSGETRTAAT
jgi:hypothetical protein